MAYLKRFLFIGAIALVWQYVAFRGVGAGESDVSIALPRIAMPPQIDGKLNEAIWQSAAKVDLVWTDKGERVKALFRTSVRVCYDDAALYVAFLNRDPAAARLISERFVVKESGQVPGSDSVGLMVDMASGGIFALFVNAANQVHSVWIPPEGLVKKMRDGAIPAVYVPVALAYPDRAWKPAGLNSATHGEGDVWVVEMRIPFEDLLSSGPLEEKRYRINFVRHIAGDDDGWVTWHHTGRDFLRPEAFGSAVFSR